MQSTVRSPGRFILAPYFIKPSLPILAHISHHCIITSTYTARTTRKDYRPTPAVILPKKELIPARKRESYETNPTPP